jgi:hypothetical protein
MADRFKVLRANLPPPYVEFIELRGGWKARSEASEGVFDAAIGGPYSEANRPCLTEFDTPTAESARS